MNKEQIKEERLIYLLEVASKFNSQNRSISSFGQCKYGGVGCAIGMRIKNKKLCEQLDSRGNSAVSNNYVFLKLPKRIQILGQEFLKELQSLHDLGHYWNNDGLSLFGQERFDYILQTHC